MKKTEGRRYTVQDFMDGKIFIDAPAGKHRDELFRVLDELGVKWASGSDLLANADKGLFVVNPQTVLATNYRGSFLEIGKYTISQGSHGFHKREDPDMPIIHAKDIDLQREIIVKFSGPMTVATAFVGGKAIGVAEAHCHPDDEYSEQIGAKVAIGRLFDVEPEKPKAVIDKEQYKILGVLNRVLGWHWLTKDSFGSVQVHTDKPKKEVTIWLSTMSNFIGPKSRVVGDLVSWDDKEPINIGKVLDDYKQRVKK